jgi:translocation and assembly module TamB
MSSAAARQPVDFHVDSSPIDLGLVQGATSAVTKVSGTLEAHVDVTGTAADPDPNGQISVTNAALTLDPTGVSYQNVNGTIALRGDRVQVQQFQAADEDGHTLTVAGDLALREKQIGGVNVAVKADDFKVLGNAFGDVNIETDMTIAGNLRAPSIQGQLGITTGELNLDPLLALSGESAYSTEATAIEAKPAAARETAASASGPQVDLHLTVPDDLVIKSNNLQMPGSSFGFGSIELTLGGDVRVRKPRGRNVRLVGTVNTVRGTYEFQGRRFSILRDGTVRFEGFAQPNPSLNITARRMISGVQTDVHIRGTLREPKLELSSVPPLEQADILSLIVFNQPINQLGEGQQISLAKRAESMAAGAVAGQLATSIGNALDLDTFEINIAPTTGTAAELTLGEQVGENLYVKLEQGVGEVATTNFILEYQLTDWLRLQTNLLEGSAIQQSIFQRLQGSGVDLIFFFSY